VRLPPRPLYLVRHGQTQWNRDGRIQGHGDSPLTELGERQARGVGRLLQRLLEAPEECDVAISPLGRCRRTATLIGEGVALDLARAVFDPDLKELAYGAWEGLTRDEWRSAYPQELALRRRDRWRHAPPDGESYAMAAERARRWLAGVTERPQPQIVICHGGIGRIIRGLYAKLEPSAILALEQPHDAVFRLVDGRVERFDAVVD
jgi:probable phosphoglycerate mutase